MDEDREEYGVVTAVGALVPVAVAAMLVLLRDHVLSANLALVLMAVVVLVAAAGGRTAGVLAALTAALSYDFFLTEPYLTLRITDDDDIETAIILLVVGVAMGQFAEWAHKNRRATQAARSELGRLRRVADLVSQGARRDDITLAGQPKSRPSSDCRSAGSKGLRSTPCCPVWSAAVCSNTPRRASLSCGISSGADSSCLPTASNFRSIIAATRSGATC